MSRFVTLLFLFIRKWLQPLHLTKANLEARWDSEEPLSVPYPIMITLIGAVSSQVSQSYTKSVRFILFTPGVW